MDIKSLLCPRSCSDLAVDTDYVSNQDAPWPAPPSSPSMSSQPSLSSLSPPVSPSMSFSPSEHRRSAYNRNTMSQTRIPWTPTEDYLLRHGYAQGLSWAMISSTYLPHRSRGCCWGRFKTLQTKSFEKREWTEAEDRLLTMAVKKHSRLFRQVWKSVAQDMNNRSWKECEVHTAKMISSIRKRGPCE